MYINYAAIPCENSCPCGLFDKESCGSDPSGGRGRAVRLHSGIVENNQSKLIIGNGTANHMHLLISMGKTIDISDLVGDIKRESSGWMKQHDRSFYWQEGYGAFSIGESQVPRVMKYIAEQKEHHARKTFEDEYRGLLKRYRVVYDERYVWD